MDNINNFLVNGLELPPELLKNIPILTMIGAQNAVIENFISILYIGEDKIVLKTDIGAMTVLGENLRLNFISQGETGITGNIKEITISETGI